MTRHNLAIDCTLYRRGMAGMGTYLLNLCEGFARVAVEGELTLFISDAEVESFARFQPTLRLRPVHVPSPLRRLAWQNFVFPFLCRQYDAVCFPSTFGPFFFPRPTAVIVHDLQYLAFPQYWGAARRAYRTLFAGRTIATATELIAISAFTASEIKTHFGRHARVVSNPVRIGVRAESASASSPQRPFYLVLGSLLPHKNIAALITALLTWPTDEALPLIVFIGPFDAQWLRNAARSNLVDARGYVAAAERDALLHDCAAVVIPSVYEGFGLPYAEALLAGKPVIACDIAPARELLGDNAIYIPAPFGPSQIQMVLKRAALQAPQAPGRSFVQALRGRTDPAWVAWQILSALRDATRK